MYTESLQRTSTDTSDGQMCEEISDEPLANNASDWLEITANLDSGQSIIPMTNDISKRISACDGQDEM